MRSTWKSLFPERFLPAPESGPTVPDNASDRFAGLWQRMTLANLAPMQLPYDTYCPSVRKDIAKRKCRFCTGYFTSMAAVQRHRRGNGCPSLNGVPVAMPNVVIDVDDDEEIPEIHDIDPWDEITPVIGILQMLAGNPFMEIDIKVEGL